MLNILTWYDLRAGLSRWPGLFFPMSCEKVMPMNYCDEQKEWLLYGRGLNKQQINDYQNQLGTTMVIISAWHIDEYQMVRLTGSLPLHATKLAHENGFDVAPLCNIPNLNTPGLLVMDMDSTAIQVECIDEIAKLAGKEKLIVKVTERAMRGELDFTTSLRQRVAILKGTGINILKQVREELQLMPGLTKLVHKMQALNWKIAIVSGGFTYFTEYLRDKLHLDYVIANELEIHDGKMTGEVLGRIVDAQCKADTLKELVHYFDILPGQTVAIGDGANDLPMIKASMLGIAYHGTPIVNKKTAVTIQHADLMGVFCILSSSLIH
ncbi:phosphoserine phosphatase [Pantoea sp. Nvir]|uniref:phosphoserine phosphatase n=1 Tax=Pantoea sp. Nvir TaxID=2576760 RepID=UPI0013571CB2|nr:phosphoserine phosphatase [Pantoea sp. Nvir]MXP66811.1 phosphoserine phosphatase [Pantoea sp. Nvir]